MIRPSAVTWPVLVFVVAALVGFVVAVGAVRS